MDRLWNFVLVRIVFLVSLLFPLFVSRLWPKGKLKKMG